MFCNRCGSNLSYEDEFCRSCGTPVIRNGESLYTTSGQADTSMGNDTDSIARTEESQSFMGKSAGIINTKTILISIITIIFLIAGGITVKSYTVSVKIKEQLKLGNKYLQESKYQEAILAFAKVIEIEPKNIDARIGLGKTYTAAGKTDEAEKVLKEALALQPKNIQVITVLTGVYIAQNKPEEAQNMINEAVKIDAKNFEVKTGLAKTHIVSGRQDEAVKILMELIETDPKNTEPYIELAKLYIDQSKFDEAIKTLQKGISETGSEIIKKLLEDVQTKLKYAKGNTSGNILNGGLFAEQGGWVYGSGRDGLYKWKADGTSKIKISNDPGSGINIMGDWIYYLNAKGICKLKTDGTNMSVLLARGPAFTCITAVGDWIYYCALSSKDILDMNGKLSQFNMYKMKTDGSDNTKLCNDNLGVYYIHPHIAVEGDWIYYQDASDNFNMYKIKTDGTGKTRYFDGRLSSINIMEDWIYYRNNSDQGRLYKMKLDGTQRTKLSDDNPANINVCGEWVYYLKFLATTPNYTSFNIYKVKTDGTVRAKVCDDVIRSDFDGNISTINIAGGWIYYHIRDSNENQVYYRIRTDGTDRQLLWKNI